MPVRSKGQNSVYRDEQKSRNGEKKDGTVVTKGKEAMNSIWKLLGLLIALGALGFKVFCTIYYYDDVMMEWGSIIYLFWGIYLVNMIALVAPFTKGILCLLISMAVTSASMLLLIGDGIFLIAKLSDGLYRSMAEMGCYPLTYLLNCIASAFNIVGYINDRKKEKSQNII